MGIEKVTQAILPVKKVLVRRSPEILTALGISGFVTTVVLACKAAPEADYFHILHAAERRSLRERGQKRDVEKLKGSYIQEAKEVLPLYAPAIISGGVSIACILGAHHVQSQRTAAIVTAYSVAERTLSTYQSKVIDKIGEDAHKDLMQAVTDKLAEEDAPFDGGYSYSPDEDGKCLCYDRVTGRYFRSTPEDIRAAESDVNKRLIDEVIVPLSEFYFALGLEDRSFVCEGLGWDLAKDKLDVYFTSMLDDEKRPCLVLNYNVSILDRRIFSGGR